MAASAVCQRWLFRSEGVGSIRSRPAVPASSAFGPMETRARPTSRGRARCVAFRMGWQREQTAAGPRAGACRLQRHALGDAALPRRGKGRCQCAGSTLFAPAGQKRFRVGAPDFGGVAGESRRSGRFAYQVRQTGAPGDGEGPAANIRRGNTRKASYSLSAQIQASVPFLPHALFPLPSRRENGGLCPHPLKGSIP